MMVEALCFKDKFLAFNINNFELIGSSGKKQDLSKSYGSSN